MVSFQNAVGLGFQHYFDFKGRSTRSEYWWWLLFVVLAGIALTIVDMGIGTFNYESGDGLLTMRVGMGFLADYSNSLR